ncbi:hypothetical protein ACFV6E_32815 [Streptomyces sp. NPDC059785]|uniref:hypothetical protein n=1 Tax=Streptomyces sp. NPDC059785 TaxID=3346945 RepID=UPI00365E5703
MRHLGWEDLVQLLVSRRAAALGEKKRAGVTSDHDWRRARAAATSAVLHALQNGESVVLVADVQRQAGEQFRMRLPRDAAVVVLRERLAAHASLLSDAVSR